jgi:hypothetical protein
MQWVDNSVTRQEDNIGLQKKTEKVDPYLQRQRATYVLLPNYKMPPVRM